MNEIKLSGEIYFPAGSTPDMDADVTFVIKYIPSNEGTANETVYLYKNGVQVHPDGGEG